MRYCSRCLYPENHPLNLVFDDEGVCSGCRVHEEKDTLDWEERRELLRGIFDEYRAKSRAIHDCIVPVSGGRDSYWIVHLVKNVFGMHPLLVSYNKHYNTRMGIRNLAYLRSLLGCDFMQQTLSPDKVREVTRASLALRGSMYWHVLAGETVYPVHVAVKFKIPLIVWGHHQGLDQVGMFSHTDEVEMTRKYRKEHDLMGLEAEDMARQWPGLRLDDLEPFVYPHDKELEAVGVRGIYLGNYVRWDSKTQHERMIEAYGYETMAQQRTFDTYNDVDSFHYSGIHDAIKFRKWGYGKVTDHACREIRLKRMTREQGIAMVRRYQDVEPADLPLFLEWIGMGREEFWGHVDRFRDPRAWERTDSGWRQRDSVVNHADDPGVLAARLDVAGDPAFRLDPPRDPGAVEAGYVLVGRGWVDGWEPPSPAGGGQAAGAGPCP